MKITASCAVVAALFFGTSSAWTAELFSQGGRRLELSQTVADDREHCIKITKPLQPVSKIVWDSQTGPWKRGHGIYFYNSDNCVSGNGYSKLEVYGAIKPLTINLKTPMRIKSYVVLV
jgi:hypothetical protein